MFPQPCEHQPRIPGQTKVADFSVTRKPFSIKTKAVHTRGQTHQVAVGGG